MIQQLYPQIFTQDQENIHSQKDLCKKFFIAALFVIADN